MIIIRNTLTVFVLATLFITCSEKQNEPKDEQIRVAENAVDSVHLDTLQGNFVKGNVTLEQLEAIPTSVVLTGLPQHRLVTVYKKTKYTASSSYSSSYTYGRSYDDDSGESERYTHFMPGLDLIYGYNLLNLAHYDLTTEKLDMLFDHPVIIKSLYYPSFDQDSIEKKPVTRNYYLVSVYDQDTNKDTLLTKKDLRHIYHFTSGTETRTALLPDDYSVVRSQYDSKNDVMYVFARHDANNNGEIEKKEPLHIFWFSLKQPAKAKRLY